MKKPHLHPTNSGRLMDVLAALKRTHTGGGAGALVLEDVERHSTEAGAEKWRVNHQRAMQVHDLEAMIESGLIWLRLLKQVDLRIRAAAFAEPDGESGSILLSVIDGIYAWWLAPRSQVEQEIAKARDEGFEVSRGDEILTEFRDVASWAETNSQASSTSRLASLIDESIEQRRAPK